MFGLPLTTISSTYLHVPLLWQWLHTWAPTRPSQQMRKGHKESVRTQLEKPPQRILNLSLQMMAGFIVTPCENISGRGCDDMTRCHWPSRHTSLRHWKVFPFTETGCQTCIGLPAISMLGIKCSRCYLLHASDSSIWNWQEEYSSLTQAIRDWSNKNYMLGCLWFQRACLLASKLASIFLVMSRILAVRHLVANHGGTI